MNISASPKTVICLLLMLITSFAQSQNEIDSLQEILKHSKDNSRKILLYNTIAEKLPSSRIDEAIQNCYVALRLSLVIKNDSLQHLCYQCLISAYYRKPYFEDSALHFVSIFENPGVIKTLPEISFKAISRIGDIYLKKHEYVTAQKYYIKALDIASMLNKPELTGAAYSSLAEVNRKSKNYEESRYYCHALVETGLKAKISWMTFSGYRGIGICYDIEGDYNNAEKYFNKALDIAKGTNSPKRMATANGLIGIARWHNKNYIGALEVLHLSEELYKPLNDEQIIPTLQNICCVYRDMNELDSALQYCKMAMAEAMKNNQQFSVSIINSIMSEIYYSKGEYKQSYEMLKAAKNFTDSSNVVESSKAIAELEKKYRTKENQAEISLLLKEKEVNELKMLQHQSELKTAKLETEEERKTGRINALDANNRKSQLENFQKAARIKDMEKQIKIDLLNEQSIRQKQQRNMAIIIGVLIIIILGYSYFAYGQNQQLKLLEQKEAAQNQMQMMRDRISRDLHDEIGSNLSKISLLSEVAKQTSEVSFRHDNLVRIANTAREALEQMNEVVWTMNKKHDSLKNLLSYLRLYAVEYFDASGINCKVNYATDISDIEIKGEERRTIFLAFKEALNNVLKHASATSVVINFKVQDSLLKISIEDNGKGIEISGSEQRKGNGLENMQERMASINGSLVILNNDGAKVEFTIPLNTLTLKRI